MKLTVFNDEGAWLAARHRNINSTEVAALFGLGQYSTAFELAVSKRQETPTAFEESDRMRWGKRLQDAIAQGVADDHGVIIEGLDLTYAEHDETRLGSSFDYRIKDHVPEDRSGMLYAMVHDRGPGILEIKNVDGLQYKRAWLDDEAPAQIEIQLQTQLEVLDMPWGCIAALIGGNRTELIIRERDREVGRSIVAKVAEFWKNLDAGILPPPIMPEDAAIITSLYQYAEPGKVLDATGDEGFRGLCLAYSAASSLASTAKKQQEVARAKLFERLGSAERAIVEGFKVSAAMVAPVEVKSHTRAGYRGLRVTEKADG